MANKLKNIKTLLLAERQQKDRFLVLYNPTQKAFHIETESEFRIHPQNGYQIYGSSDTRVEAERILKKLVRVLTLERR